MACRLKAGHLTVNQRIRVRVPTCQPIKGDTMTRAERRFRRECAIAKRLFVWHNVWKMPHKIEGGVYAKFNMNCGCTLCHAEKYFKYKRKRREALKSATSE